MKRITREITVDLSRKSNARIVFATQNDLDSRCLHITLTDDGKPYFVPTNTTATILFKRCDDTKGAFLAKVLTDGTIQYTINRKIIGIVGQTQCVVSLESETLQRLTSAPFIIDVADTLYFGQQEEGEEMATLVDELLRSYTSMERSELDRVVNETYRNVAEEKRVQAETARANAETARANAETARAKAESQRASAEQGRRTSETQRVSNEAGRRAAEEQRSAAEIQRAEAVSRRIGELDMSKQNADDAAKRANDISMILEAKLENGEFVGEKGDKGDRGERGYSGLVQKQSRTYSPAVSVPSNVLVDIAALEGDIGISLGEGVVGYDNEWVFTVTQGEVAYNVMLPAIEWTLGIAPVFAADSVTEIRLHYKGERLMGVWN